MPSQSQRVLGAVALGVAALLAVFAYVRLSPSFGELRSGGNGKNGKLTIGYSISSHREARWAVEGEIMKTEAERLGATLITSVADGDPDKQVMQAKELMDQGAKVLIVVAQDAEKAAAIVDEAHVRGVQVIAYDRLIKGANLDYYLTFDNVKVGEEQARGVLDAVGRGNFAYIGGSPTDNNATLVREGSFNVLKPKIENGDVKIVLDKQIPDWDAELAYKEMAAFLRNGVRLDAAVVANDGMAAGVIKALAERGLAGKVPVSGQDAELRACQDIIKGTQTVTIYKPLRSLAEEAVHMAIAVMKQDPVRTNAAVNNGKIPVPSRLLNVIAVTKANMDNTIILDGFHTREEVYGAE